MESGLDRARVTEDAAMVVSRRDDGGLDQDGGSGDGEEMGAEKL